MTTNTAILDGVTGWLGLPLALAIGLLLGASPFSWPVMAVATGTHAVTDTSRGRRPSPAVLGLGAAVVVVYAALGLVADRLDAVVRGGIGSWTGPLYAGLAVATIAAGALLLARPALLCRAPRGRRPGTTHLGGFLVGVPLALANCPACAGIITGVALAASQTGSTAYAVAAMGALGLGHAAALAVGSTLLVRPVRDLTRVATAVQRVGAVVLLGVGAWYAVQAWRYGLTVAEPLP